MDEPQSLAGPVSDILRTLSEPPSDEPSLEQDQRDWELRHGWRYQHPCEGRDPTAEELESYRQDVAEQARQHRQRQCAAKLERFIASVGERYDGVSLASFQIEHPGQQAVVDAVNDYRKNGRENIQAGRGIVLYGPSGTGKDHLLIALGIGAINAGFDVVATSGPKLASELRDLIDTREPEEDFFRRYTKPHILLLSDPLPPGGTLTNFQAEGLYQIVDERYRRRKTTWVSLNVASGSEADQRLGSPIVDRLRDGALCLKCEWPSFRKAWDPEAK